MSKIDELNDALRGEAYAIIESSGIDNYSIVDDTMTIETDAFSFYHNAEVYMSAIHKIVALQIYEVVLKIK